VRVCVQALALAGRCNATPVKQHSFVKKKENRLAPPPPLLSEMEWNVMSLSLRSRPFPQFPSVWFPTPIYIFFLLFFSFSMPPFPFANELLSGSSTAACAHELAKKSLLSYLRKSAQPTPLDYAVAEKKGCTADFFPSFFPQESEAREGISLPTFCIK
jgi:hypothetical protein